MYAFAVKLRLKLEGNVARYIKALFSTKTAITVHFTVVQYKHTKQNMGNICKLE